MHRTLSVLSAAVLLAFATSCSTSSNPAPSNPAPAESMTLGKVYDNQLTNIEKEFVPLVEAMPADKFNFAPTQGEFKGVRTFAKQAKHAAAVLYLVSGAILGEKPPVDTGGENGPDSVQTKDQVVQFVKDAFAYAHKAAISINPTNEMDKVKSPFGNDQVARASLGTVLLWHSFDHYGQMVIYLRMNGIVPPASR